MGKGFDIPWVGGRVNIPSVGIRYIIVRWFDIPWVGGSQNNMSKTVLYTMGRAFEIPHVGVLIYLL
jgi:hypothetical protein